MAVSILALLGMAVVLSILWCGCHVRREVLRHRQVARMRTALDPRTNASELRERCGTDLLPRYLAPAGVLGIVDTTTLADSVWNVVAL
ncbi:hypothetical protein ACRAKI_22235 [Saccharothrix isguenensis]